MDIKKFNLVCNSHYLFRDVEYNLINVDGLLCNACDTKKRTREDVNFKL